MFAPGFLARTCSGLEMVSHSLNSTLMMSLCMPEEGSTERKLLDSFNSESATGTKEVLKEVEKAVYDGQQKRLDTIFSFLKKETAAHRGNYAFIRNILIFLNELIENELVKEDVLARFDSEFKGQIKDCYNAHWKWIINENEHGKLTALLKSIASAKESSTTCIRNISKSFDGVKKVVDRAKKLTFREFNSQESSQEVLDRMEASKGDVSVQTRGFNSLLSILLSGKEVEETLKDKIYGAMKSAVGVILGNSESKRECQMNFAYWGYVHLKGLVDKVPEIKALMEYDFPSTERTGSDRLSVSLSNVPENHTALNVSLSCSCVPVSKVYSELPVNNSKDFLSKSGTFGALGNLSAAVKGGNDSIKMPNTESDIKLPLSDPLKPDVNIDNVQMCSGKDSDDEDEDDELLIVSGGNEKEVPLASSNKKWNKISSAIDFYEKTRPDFYETLEESLKTAEFTNISSMMKYSREIASYLKHLGEYKAFGMTQADFMALTIYTYDNGLDHFEDNPYRIINKTLGERNTDRALKLRGYILRLLAALRKLPAYGEKNTLYRAVTNVSDRYKEIGNELTWPAFTSTSSDENVVIDFFNNIAIKGEKYIFEITGCFNKCHNIKDFSFHSNEDGKQFYIPSYSIIFLFFFI